jgi:hypothetical protein
MDDATQTNIRTLKHLGEDLVLRNRAVLRALCHRLEDWSAATPPQPGNDRTAPAASAAGS